MKFETIVHNTLQQQRPSGDINALFQIKVQVKDLNVNALFDCGSQCNLIYEKLIDKLGLETHDLVKQSSLTWLQGKYDMKISRRHKI